MSPRPQITAGMPAPANRLASVTKVTAPALLRPDALQAMRSARDSGASNGCTRTSRTVSTTALASVARMRGGSSVSTQSLTRAAIASASAPGIGRNSQLSYVLRAMMLTASLAVIVPALTVV